MSSIAIPFDICIETITRFSIDTGIGNKTAFFKIQDI